MNGFIAGRYHLRQPLRNHSGQTFYSAFHQPTGDMLAIRLLTLRLSPSAPTDRARLLDLLRAIRQLSHLRHPNLLPVTDGGLYHEADGETQFFAEPFTVHPLIGDLAPLIDAARPAPLADQITWCINLLSALDYLHRSGWLHRNLKPANLWITPDGALLLTDYGLVTYDTRSVISLEAKVAGTLAYLAPELVLEKPASVQSDLYAVGIIAYEIIAGKYPFDNRNVAFLIRHILNEQPNFERLPAELVGFVRRMVAKDPAERYASAAEALEALCAATGRAAPPLSPPHTAAVPEIALEATPFGDVLLPRLAQLVTPDFRPISGLYHISAPDVTILDTLLQEIQFAAQLVGVQLVVLEHLADLDTLEAFLTSLYTLPLWIAGLPRAALIVATPEIINAAQFILARFADQPLMALWGSVQPLDAPTLWHDADGYSLTFLGSV